jgi:membrane protein CcdC involved in cytochrome C biogenesis
MKNKAFCKSEESKLESVVNFKLPLIYKKIGWVFFFTLLLVILSTKFFDSDQTILKSILRKGMLLALLIISISKEPIEDEMIASFRGKAFSFAFIVGVLYVLIQPLLNFIVAFILGREKDIFENLGDFQILWFMLVVYLTAFWFLKKKA